MEAIILAGGKGVRLRPYTVALPKPLVPIGEEPILEIIMKQLKFAGVNKITIAVNHMADIIMAFFGKGEKYGIKIEYSIEDKPLSTVAPIKLIKYLPEHFLVMNGDILTDLNYGEFFHSHIASNAQLSIATYKRSTQIDFGVLDIDKTCNQAIGFREKPIFHFDVSMGIYVFSRSILKYVPKDRPYGIDNLIIDMLNNHNPIVTYPYDGYWLDIGRPDDYEKANQDRNKIMSIKGE